MTQPVPQGIRRDGLDRNFVEQESRKSQLLLEARLLREQGEDESAADKFAAAAEIESHLSDVCATHGLMEKSHVHRFSAAGCWAQAGNFHDAIQLCQELLASPDLSPRLRQDVEAYARNIRTRRNQWSETLKLASVNR